MHQPVVVVCVTKISFVENFSNLHTSYTKLKKHLIRDGKLIKNGIGHTFYKVVIDMYSCCKSAIKISKCQKRKRKQKQKKKSD
jgi:hypothetical protein